MLKNIYNFNLFNATFTSNENIKTEIRLNRITKTVSFESVNVGSGFFLFFLFVLFLSLSNAHNKTRNISVS